MVLPMIYMYGYFHIYFCLQFEEGVDILVQVDIYEKLGSDSDIKKNTGAPQTVLRPSQDRKDNKPPDRPHRSQGTRPSTQ